MIQFQALTDTKSTNTEIEMYRLIIDRKLMDTFPNVETVLRIYLCLMVTNCSGERSFSKLRMIKNYMRSTMGQDRLTNLTILSTESDILENIDTDSVI